MTGCVPGHVLVYYAAYHTQQAQVSVCAFSCCLCGEQSALIKGMVCDITGLVCSGTSLLQSCEPSWMHQAVRAGQRRVDWREMCHVSCKHTAALVHIYVLCMRQAVCVLEWLLPAAGVDELVQLGEKFVEDIRAGRHQQEGWSNSMYGEAPGGHVYTQW